MEVIQDELKGRLRPGSSWLFVGDDVDNPYVSSSTFTYTENDKKRVLLMLNTFVSLISMENVSLHI